MVATASGLIGRAAANLVESVSGHVIAHVPIQSRPVMAKGVNILDQALKKLLVIHRSAQVCDIWLILSNSNSNNNGNDNRNSCAI